MTDATIGRVWEVEARWIHFEAWGHENVTALHRSTLEITTDDYLTPRGDCIIGIRAPVAAAGLPEWFKRAARSRSSVIVMVLCAGGVCDSLVGRGDPGLEYTSPNRLVARRSTYVGGDTLMVEASKAARDLRRDLVEELRKGGRLDVYITVLEGVLSPSGDAGLKE